MVTWIIHIQGSLPTLPNGWGGVHEALPHTEGLLSANVCSRCRSHFLSWGSHWEAAHALVSNTTSVPMQETNKTSESQSTNDNKAWKVGGGLLGRRGSWKWEEG